MTDSELQHAIERELTRNSRIGEPNIHVEVHGGIVTLRERDAARVKVEVFNGIITLSGTVRSSSEKELVLRTVHNSPNIRGVEDHLNFEPYAV